MSQFSIAGAISSLPLVTTLGADYVVKLLYRKAAKSKDYGKLNAIGQLGQGTRVQKQE